MSPILKRKIYKQEQQLWLDEMLDERKMTPHRDYHSYMVRICRQTQNDGIHLQITLEDIQTGKRRDFTDLKELFEFLQDEINGELPMDNSEDLSHEMIA